jgi:hypothetical protein
MTMGYLCSWLPGIMTMGYLCSWLPGIMTMGYLFSCQLAARVKTSVGA